MPDPQCVAWPARVAAVFADLGRSMTQPCSPARNRAEFPGRGIARSPSLPLLTDPAGHAAIGPGVPVVGPGGIPLECRHELPTARGAVAQSGISGVDGPPRPTLPTTPAVRGRTRRYPPLSATTRANSGSPERHFGPTYRPDLPLTPRSYRLPALLPFEPVLPLRARPQPRAAAAAAAAVSGHPGAWQPGPTPRPANAAAARARTRKTRLHEPDKVAADQGGEPAVGRHEP